MATGSPFSALRFPACPRGRQVPSPSKPPLEFGSVEVDLNERLAALAVVLVEPIGTRAVQIEDAQNRSILDQGHDELGPRGAVAGDVPRKGVDIGDDYRGLPLHGRAANPAPHR